MRLSSKVTHNFVIFSRPRSPFVPTAKTHVGVLLNKHNIIIMYYITPIYVYAHAIYVRNNISLLYARCRRCAHAALANTIMAQDSGVVSAAVSCTPFAFFYISFSSFYFPLSLQDGLPRKSLSELIYLLRRFAEHP